MQSQGMYRFEHWFAWLLAIGAIVLAIVGALAAFDVITLRTVTIAETPLVEVEAESGTTHFRDGVLLLLSAITLGILAWAMHSAEHHVAITGGATQTAGRRGETGRDAATYAGGESPRTNSGSRLGMAEHWLAYLGLIFTIVLGTVAILVGFNVFDDGYSWRDGTIWGLLAITAGAITATLHSVQHHAMPVYDVDDIRVMVEERVGSAMQRQGTLTGATAMATASGAAGTQGGMPGTQHDMPGGQRDMPATQGGMPGAQGVTGSQGGMPGTPRDVPDNVREISDTARDVPDNLGDVPGTGGAPGPGTQGGTPGERDTERPL